MTLQFIAPYLLPAIVTVPLLAAICNFLMASHHPRLALNALFGLAQVLLAGLLLIALSLPDTVVEMRYILAGWSAPLGIELIADGLAAILLMTTAVLYLVLSVYSALYFTDKNKGARFWPLWWLLATGLNGVFLAGDAFNIYVTLEIIGLASVALIALSGDRAALVAALRYALVGLLGSLCYLLGVALLYRAYGTLDLAQLASLAEANPLTWAALSLISVGLLLKTALLPLHFWLPPAHASAPVPVSAVLSGLVVKASFYLMVRFWLDILPVATTTLALQLLGVLGTAAIFWGCISAYRAHRLKVMVAYSTVAQVGYLFLLFPLSATSIDAWKVSGGALAAIVYFVVAHALAKSAMFIAAGNIMFSYRHDDIDGLRGIAREQPLDVFTFAIAGASLIGLPPSAGFIAKWLLLGGAISSGQWWWAAAILFGGLLAAAYIFRFLNVVFDQSQAAELSAQRHARPVPLTMALCGLALAVMAILMGFNAGWMLELLSVSAAVSA